LAVHTKPPVHDVPTGTLLDLEAGPSFPVLADITPTEAAPVFA
jgi:hypothetical protein